jgi:hypothetical protein
MENFDKNKLINNSIRPNQIINKDIFTTLLDDLVCLICLNIPLEPLQCSTCDMVICKDCLEILYLSEKNCLSPECQKTKTNVKVLYSKATKYLKEILSKLNVKCCFCNSQEINYEKYQNHLEICLEYKAIENKREDFIKEIQDKKEKEELLLEELKSLKSNSKKSKEDTPEEIKIIRDKLIVNTLSATLKRNYHDHILNGNLTLLMQFININNYPIFEEISAKGYFWTPLHYAMHYGQKLIISFLLDLLKKKGLYHEAMRLRSSDLRCPVLCLLKSNSLKNEEKRKLFEYLLEKYDIEVTLSIRKEANAREFNDLLLKYGK